MRSAILPTYSFRPWGRCHLSASDSDLHALLPPSNTTPQHRTPTGFSPMTTYFLIISLPSFKIPVQNSLNFPTVVDVAPPLSCQRHFASESLTKSQLNNNRSNSTQHNNAALFRAHITLQNTPEPDQRLLISLPGNFCVSFHHCVVLPVTFFLRLFPSAPASREVTLA